MAKHRIKYDGESILYTVSFLGMNFQYLNNTGVAVGESTQVYSLMIDMERRLSKSLYKKILGNYSVFNLEGVFVMDNFINHLNIEEGKLIDTLSTLYDVADDADKKCNCENCTCEDTQEVAPQSESEALTVLKNNIGEYIHISNRTTSTNLIGRLISFGRFDGEVSFMIEGYADSFMVNNFYVFPKR